MWFEFLVSNGLIPEFLIRLFLRMYYELRFLRLPEEVEEIQEHLNEVIAEMKKSPIAISTDTANEQHYELPTAFFTEILGKYMKYSCGYWKTSSKKSELIGGLDRSEEEMLKISCRRAQVKDGEKILDLGCGWGSLSLYIKDHYKNTRITAVSNSSTQKEYIESIAQARDITDIQVISGNIAELDLEEKFDVIVSIEMFEHMRNWQKLMEKLSKFLKEDGRLFIHIFTDKNHPYFFETDNERNWMAQYFFRGGLMPSTDLLLYFSNHFSIQKVWKVNGTHYAHTLNAWLKKMKSNKVSILPLLEAAYGKAEVRKWWNYWKLFFISLSEVFGFEDGNQRFVTHYLFKKR
ncbi:MAG: methyltransferase domain-containing protein [Candidatus Lokiarchaeota archaeon]|nr:methyltransferase domain-containing protein [Candidatus Lokiarchaeota archaeon]